MFGKMMNNYYYGKSGKGDYRKEDMPATRWQLFLDTLRTRLSALCRLNLIYVVIFLPVMIVIGLHFVNTMSNLNIVMAAQEGNLRTMLEEQAAENGGEVTITDEQVAEIAQMNPADMIESALFSMLLWLIPCIAITGPFTAGVCYVTRNWARDEHAFIWSDFKDAVRENWKQGLVLSAITSVIPVLVYLGWRYYGQMAQTQVWMVLPQVLVVMVAVVWALSITYMYPLIVTYELRLRDVIRNALLLAVARLPLSLGVRLLHCVPALLCALLAYFWNPMYGMLILGAWYFLIGFCLSRFVTASYTNAVFDRFINPRIEGAQVNRGLRETEDEDDDEEDDGNMPETVPADPGDAKEE